MADQEQLVSARLAYQEVCKSYQAIVDFRAKLLGFLPLASGVGAYAVLSKETPPAWEWVAGLFGFMVTLGLFLYELRGLQRAAALEQVGRELEAEIGLTNGQFQEQPGRAAGRLRRSQGRRVGDLPNRRGELALSGSSRAWASCPPRS